MSCPQVQEAVSDLLPTQLGVAVEGACETKAMAIQQWVGEYGSLAEYSILQVDLANAFNSLDRHHMLHQVALRAPQLSAWASFCYRSHSHLFLQNGHPLSSQQGVQQGDPLGPLFFSLAWHSVIEALPTNLSMNLWYLDDGHLIGTPDSLRSYLAILESEGAKIGMCV